MYMYIHIIYTLYIHVIVLLKPPTIINHQQIISGEQERKKHVDIVDLWATAPNHFRGGRLEGKDFGPQTRSEVTD